MQVQTTEKMRVLVVDDQRAVREIVCSNLENEPDLEVVGTAADGDEAIEATARLQPDVVLLDVVMRNTDGLTATNIITERFPNTRILILSGHDSEEYLSRALQAGAHGYVPKNSDVAELVNAIRAVHHGHPRMDAGSASEIPLQEEASSEALSIDRDAELVGAFGGANYNGTRSRAGFAAKDRYLLEELQKNQLTLQADVRDLRARHNSFTLRITKLEKQVARARGTIGVLIAIVVVLGFFILFYSPDSLNFEVPPRSAF